MKYCTNCGHKLDENDSFCTECGKAVKEVKKENKSEEKKDITGYIIIGVFILLGILLVKVINMQIDESKTNNPSYKSDNSIQFPFDEIWGRDFDEA